MMIYQLNEYLDKVAKIFGDKSVSSLKDRDDIKKAWIALSACEDRYTEELVWQRLEVEYITTEGTPGGVFLPSENITEDIHRCLLEGFSIHSNVKLVD